MPTLSEELAAFFRAHPNVWIDAHELLSVAGFAGWRSRLSDIRRPPFSMRIENRTSHGGRAGHRFTRSEYKYVPPEAR